MDRRHLARFALPPACLGLALLTAGLLGGWYVYRLQARTAAVLGDNVASMKAAQRLEIRLRHAQTLLYQYRATGDRASLDRVPALNAEAAALMAEAERLAGSDAERESAARARAAFDRYLAAFEGGGDPADRLRARGVIDRILTEELLPPTHAYLAWNEGAADRASAENAEAAERLVPALVMLGACGCTAGLLAGFGLARGVKRSIAQLSVPARDAAGKLSEVAGPVAVTSPTRLEDLEALLRAVASEVGTVVGHLQEARRDVLHREQLAAMGQLAAGMAHELRNPLTSIKMLVQLAARRPGRADLTGKHLEVLEQEVGRLEQCVQSLLDFARPPRPQRRRLAAAALVGETVALLSARAGSQGAEVVAADEGVPEVEADPVQFRQLVLNLLLNALDAAGPGRVEVRLRTDPPGFVALEVSDTGPGLPAELGERIFEPFVSTKETGTGLGLSICRRVVEAHGGSLSAGNRAGGGAVFTARFPAAGPGTAGG